MSFVLIVLEMDNVVPKVIFAVMDNVYRIIPEILFVRIVLLPLITITALKDSVKL